MKHRVYHWTPQEHQPNSI